MCHDFRFALREGAREAHDCVDALFSQLDFQHRQDYQRFLLIHAASFGVLGHYADRHCLTQDLLARMNAQLKADLAGFPASAFTPGAPVLAQAPDPLAIDYVVCGSRLGSQLLSRRWLQSRDAVVRAAGGYLNLPHNPELWRTVCAALSALAPDGRRAARIVRDVRAVFGLFIESGRGVQAPAMAEGQVQ